MDKLPPELISQIVEFALEDDINGDSRQKRRLFQYGMVNKRWHDALDARHAAELVLRPRSSRFCPAISASGAVHSAYVVWSANDHWRLRYDGTEADGLATNDLNLLPAIARLVLVVIELATPVGARVRALAYLLAKPAMLGRLTSLELVGLEAAPVPVILGVLALCTHLKQLAILPCWPWPSLRAEYQAKQASASRPLARFGYVPEVALPFQLKTLKLEGTGNLVYRLLGPPLSDGRNVSERRMEGLAEGCDVSIGHLELLAHATMQTQVQYLGSLQVTSPLPDGEVDENLGRFEQVKHLDLASVEQYQLLDLLLHFPALEHLVIRHIPGSLPFTITPIATLRKLELPAELANPSRMWSHWNATDGGERARIERFCERQGVELSWLADRDEQAADQR